MPPGLQTFLFFQQGGAEATSTSTGKAKNISRVVFVRGGEKTARNDVGKGRRQHSLPVAAVVPPWGGPAPHQTVNTIRAVTTAA